MNPRYPVVAARAAHRAARSRADLLRAGRQRDPAGQRHRADHRRPRLSRTARGQRQGAEKRHLITAEEVYFHCGKALIRSDLWNPEKHLRRAEFPSLGRVLTEQISGVTVGDPERVEGYKARLY